MALGVKNSQFSKNDVLIMVQAIFRVRLNEDSVVKDSHL